MRLEAPGWWYGGSPAGRLTASVLAPLGVLYGAGVKTRFALAKPYRSTLPVVCIGNFTVGGAGKTPLALAVEELLGELGHRPAFLTRGYGGRLAGPHLVDPARDTAADTGDEALLLARKAPAMLARNRADGARAIEELGASVIVMDDGFQTPSLVKDLSLIAVDAGAGIGNGRVFPAGPLRAPLRFQLRRAGAVVLIGNEEGNGCSIAELGSRPALKARLKPACNLEWMHGSPLLAFCGIGRPEKFFAMLRGLGADLAVMQAFPDHHPFTEADAASLIARAEAAGALLVTTEKDHVRLRAGTGAIAALKAKARAVPVALDFTPEARDALIRLLGRLEARAGATEL